MEYQDDANATRSSLLSTSSITPSQCRTTVKPQLQNGAKTEINRRTIRRSVSELHNTTNFYFSSHLKTEIREMNIEVRQLVMSLEKEIIELEDDRNSNGAWEKIKNERLNFLYDMKKMAKEIQKGDCRNYDFCKRITEILEGMIGKEKKNLRELEKMMMEKHSNGNGKNKEEKKGKSFGILLLFRFSRITKIVNFKHREDELKMLEMENRKLDEDSQEKFTNVKDRIGVDKNNVLKNNITKIDGKKAFQDKFKNALNKVKNSQNIVDSPLYSPVSPRFNSGRDSNPDSPFKILRSEDSVSGKVKLRSAVKGIMTLFKKKKIMESSSVMEKKAHELMTCRLCEEEIEVEYLRDHCKFCYTREKFRNKIDSVNRKLVFVYNAVEKVWDYSNQERTRVRMRNLEDKEKKVFPVMIKLSSKMILLKIAGKGITKNDGANSRKLDSILKKMKKLLENNSKIYTNTKNGGKRLCRTVPNYLKTLIALGERKKVLFSMKSDYPGVEKLGFLHNMTINDFHIKGLISCGAYGRVYLCDKKTTKDLYAVKVLERDAEDKKSKEKNIMVEAGYGKNPYVANLLYSFSGKKFRYFVMEFCPGGDLLTLLRRERILEVQQVKQYVCEMISCLEHFREKKIIHRDLKPDNILIDSRGHIKMTDFGLSEMGMIDRDLSYSNNNFDSFSTNGGSFFSMNGGSMYLKRSNTLFDDPNTPCVLVKNDSVRIRTKSSRRILDTVGHTNKNEQRVEKITSFWKNKNENSPEKEGNVEDGGDDGDVSGVKGTPDYLAPEVLLGKKHSFGVDYWALGVVTFQLLIGFTPFGGNSPDVIFSNILNNNPNWPDNLDLYELPDESIDFIKRLLVKDQKRRLGVNGVEEIKKHPWFKDVNWDKVLDEIPIFCPITLQPDSLELFEKRQRKGGFNENDLVTDFKEDLIKKKMNAGKVFVNGEALIEMTKKALEEKKIKKKIENSALEFDSVPQNLDEVL